MDNVKNSHFSGSWYPADADGVGKQLRKWEKQLSDFEKNIISGVVPHAGWFFSGMMAYDVIRRISRDTEVLVVLGGHLPDQYPFLYPREDYLETPCGNLVVARNFIDLIASDTESAVDLDRDNTIEVQLPIIKSLFKDIQVVPVRVPSGSGALKLIEILYKFAEENSVKMALIGSTDLTHYGPNYGFIPSDSIGHPRQWVEDSDRKILNAMTGLKEREILNLANAHHCACSAGAAAGAAYYASLNGVKKGRLLHYDTSYSKHESDSFVGYGSVVYET